MEKELLSGDCVKIRLLMLSWKCENTKIETVYKTIFNDSKISHLIFLRDTLFRFSFRFSFELFQFYKD